MSPSSIFNLFPVLLHLDYFLGHTNNNRSSYSQHTVHQTHAGSSPCVRVELYWANAKEKMLFDLCNYTSQPIVNTTEKSMYPFQAISLSI